MQNIDPGAPAVPGFFLPWVHFRLQLAGLQFLVSQLINFNFTVVSWATRGKNHNFLYYCI
jgi:hypothetical protein